MFESVLRRSRLALFGVLTAVGVASAWAQPTGSSPFGTSQPIRGQYIVVFNASVGNPAAEAVSAVRGAGGGQILHTYTAAIKGFAATLPDAAVQALSRNPNVDYIEQDQTVSLSQTESSATWGIDRVDQHALPLDSTYHYNYTGLGVNAFIIDTGIRADHVEFTGRVLSGFTSISDGNGTNDCNGHGTHVSGTIGGTTYGIAKQVTLTPVRVLDCSGSGSWSGVIAGIDWVANNPLRPAVANMSLGGGFSSSVNAAVAGAVSKGVTIAVAAGNSSANACNYSPSSEPSAVTVGATTSTDSRASYSNFGTCVDIFAPGSSITSAWNTSSTATNTISGTSMATPHVTGTAALLAQANPGAAPATIASLLTSTATTGVVGSPGTGSPNLLLYTLGTGGTTPPPPTVETVAVRSITTGTSTTGNPNHPKAWQAQATVTIFDTSTNATVANASVTGSFAPGSTSTCVTTSSGSCTLGSGNLSLSATTTVFTVTGVSGTNMSYNPGANFPTQVTITR